MTRTAAAALAALAAATAIAAVVPQVAPVEPAAKVSAAPPGAPLSAYAAFRPHALLSWNPQHRAMLIEAPADGSATVRVLESPGGATQPLDAMLDGATRAQFEPAKGAYIVFARRGGGRLFRYDVATREVGAIGDPAEAALEFAFAPAGERLAYLSRAASGVTLLHAVDPRRPASDRVVAQLGPGTWRDLAVSANGDRMAVVAEEPRGGASIWIVDAHGRKQRITSAARAPVHYRTPRFGKDGRALFAISDRGSEYRRLVLVDVATGRERALTGHLKYDIDAFAVSHAVSKLAFIANEHGSHVLRFLDTVTLKEQPRPSLVEGVIGGLAFRPGTGEIGFHIAAARTAGDVFSYDIRENRFTRWTNGNNPAVNTSDLPEPRIVRWKSFDGRDITALHYPPPPGFTGRRPVVVCLEEAPGEQALAGFRGADNYLPVEMGVAVIYPNVRGASGFGRAFEALDDGPRREDRVKDVGALLDWIAAQPDLDAERVTVVGRGGGSELARAVLQRYAARVAGGEAEAAAGAATVEAVGRTLRR